MRNWINLIESEGSIVAYHGTNVEFDKFDFSKGKIRGARGHGIYFADRYEEAAHYGKIVMKCRLNIQKPLIDIRRERGEYPARPERLISQEMFDFLAGKAEDYYETGSWDANHFNRKKNDRELTVSDSLDLERSEQSWKLRYDRLRGAGYDCIIGKGVLSDAGGPPYTQYVVINPSIIEIIDRTVL